jgi:hypothetical protein
VTAISHDRRRAVEIPQRAPRRADQLPILTAELDAARATADAHTCCCRGKRCAGPHCTPQTSCGKRAPWTYRCLHSTPNPEAESGGTCVQVPPRRTGKASGGVAARSLVGEGPPCAFPSGRCIASVCPTAKHFRREAGPACLTDPAGILLLAPSRRSQGGRQPAEAYSPGL